AVARLDALAQGLKSLRHQSAYDLLIQFESVVVRACDAVLLHHAQESAVAATDVKERPRRRRQMAEDAAHLEPVQQRLAAYRDGVDLLLVIVSVVRGWIDRR